MEVHPSIRTKKSNWGNSHGNQAKSTQSKMDTSTIQRIFQLLKQEMQDSESEEEVEEGETETEEETQEINFLV
jgi:hypothetical protein